MEKRKLRRKCYHCGQIFTVGVDIEWRACPYAAEIHEDYERVWHCDECTYACRDEI